MNAIIRARKVREGLASDGFIEPHPFRLTLKPPPLQQLWSGGGWRMEKGADLLAGNGSVLSSDIPRRSQPSMDKRTYAGGQKSSVVVRGYGWCSPACTGGLARRAVVPPSVLGAKRRDIGWLRQVDAGLTSGSGATAVDAYCYPEEPRFLLLTAGRAMKNSHKGLVRYGRICYTETYGEADSANNRTDGCLYNRAYNGEAMGVASYFLLNVYTNRAEQPSCRAGGSAEIVMPERGETPTSGNFF